MPSFQQIWDQHPNVTGEERLLDHAEYPNQCAVNLYAAFRRSGVNVASFPGQLSWQKDKPKYAIRAQELANWIAKPGMALGAKTEKFGGKKAFDEIDGRKSIIFLQNYWGPGRQGDHIDLWNGSRLTDWKSWARVHLHISWDGLWSDYRKAENVWFWSVP